MKRPSEDDGHFQLVKPCPTCWPVDEAFFDLPVSSDSQRIPPESEQIPRQPTEY